MAHSGKYQPNQEQHAQADHRIGGGCGNLAGRDQGGDATQNQEQRQSVKVMAVMVAMPVKAMAVPAVTVTAMRPGFGLVFIEGKFVAHADV